MVKGSGATCYRYNCLNLSQETCCARCLIEWCVVCLAAGPRRRFWPEHGSWWMLRRRTASLRCTWLHSTTTAMWPRSSSRRWAGDKTKTVTLFMSSLLHSSLSGWFKKLWHHSFFFFYTFNSLSLIFYFFWVTFKRKKTPKHFCSSSAGTMWHQHPQQSEPDAAAAGSYTGPHRLGAAAGGRGRRRQHGGRGRWHGHARGPPPPTAGQRHAQSRCGNQQHRGQQRGLLLHVTLLQGESDGYPVWISTWLEGVHMRLHLFNSVYCWGWRSWRETS